MSREPGPVLAPESRWSLAAVVPLFAIEVMLAPVLGAESMRSFAQRPEGMVLAGVAIGGMLLTVPLVAVITGRRTRTHVWAYAAFLVAGSLGLIWGSERLGSGLVVAAALMVGLGRAGCLLFLLTDLLSLRDDQRRVQAFNSSMQRLAAVCAVVVTTIAAVTSDLRIVLWATLLASCGYCVILALRDRAATSSLPPDPVRGGGVRSVRRAFQQVLVVVGLLVRDRLTLCSGVLNLLTFFTLFMANVTIPQLFGRSGAAVAFGPAMLTNPLLLREVVAIAVGVAFAVARPRVPVRWLLGVVGAAFTLGFAALTVSSAPAVVAVSQLSHGVALALAVLTTNLLVSQSSQAAGPEDAVPIGYRVAATQIPIGAGILISVPVVSALSSISLATMFAGCLLTSVLLACALMVLHAAASRSAPSVVPEP